MARMNAAEERFEEVTVLGLPMLFSDLRIDRESVPKGYFMYEVRHGDDDWGDPCQLATWIMVNHYGTLISAQPVKLEKSPTINNSYRDIDPDKDWNFDGGACTLKEYMDKYPPFQERRKEYER